MDCRFMLTDRVNVEEIGTWVRQTGSRLGIMEVTQWVASDVGWRPAANHQKLITRNQE